MLFNLINALESNKVVQLNTEQRFENVSFEGTNSDQLSGRTNQHSREIEFQGQSAYAAAFDRLLLSQQRLRHETHPGLPRTPKHHSYRPVHANGGASL